MTPKLIVIIATRNRQEALGKYALPSLQHSIFQDFTCVVWDASDGNETEKSISNKNWPFEIDYVKAPRLGLTSQRNDAVLYALKKWNSALYLTFIDDDSELSCDALGGVLESFKSAEVFGVNIPVTTSDILKNKNSIMNKLFNSHDREVLLPFLYNSFNYPEKTGITVQWTSGCGMAFRVEVFVKYRLFFPEEFQLFGGYALAEDVAFSFFLHEKLKKKIINSINGHLIHHMHTGGRLDLERMTAARWYNSHLFFDAIYNNVSRGKYYRCKILFEIYHLLAFLKNFFLYRSFKVFKGYWKARQELKKSNGIFREVKL